MDADTLHWLAVCAGTPDAAVGARLALDFISADASSEDAHLFVARPGGGFGIIGAGLDMEDAGQELADVCGLVLHGAQPMGPGDAPGELSDCWLLPLQIDDTGVGVLVARGGREPAADLVRAILTVHADRLHHMAVRRANETLIGTLSSYLNSEVVDELKRRPGDALSTAVRRTWAVAMFVDLSGFTTMSERLAPEKVVETLNAYFARLHAVVDMHRGVIDKHIGDAALVVFEPEFKESESACIGRVLDTAADLLQQFPPNSELAVHISAACGGVVVGNVGSARRVERTVIGDTVNLAARLQSYADDGEVAIDGDIERAMRGLIRGGHARRLIICRRKRHRVRGRAHPVSVSVLRLPD